MIPPPDWAQYQMRQRSSLLMFDEREMESLRTRCNTIQLAASFLTVFCPRRDRLVRRSLVGPAVGLLLCSVGCYCFVTARDVHVWASISILTYCRREEAITAKLSTPRTLFRWKTTFTIRSSEAGSFPFDIVERRIQPFVSHCSRRCRRRKFCIFPARFRRRKSCFQCQVFRW
jgi:hypothetical protein